MFIYVTIVFIVFIGVPIHEINNALLCGFLQFIALLVMPLLKYINVFNVITGIAMLEPGHSV